MEKSLRQYYSEHTGKLSDKWSLYLDEYDRLFDFYKNKPVRLLEIGVQNGGSLEIWSKFFKNAKALVGCDINKDCNQLKYDETNIHLVVGDANSKEAGEQIFKYSSQFDIIIDDGSHCSNDIIKSFTLYFPHLEVGGLFIVEDLHCSYWSQFQGGLYDPYSSISFFKLFVDLINHEHWGVHKSRLDLLGEILQNYECKIEADLLSQIHSVEFINSMCVIRKKAPNRNILGHRVIAGLEEAVMPGISSLNNVTYELDKALNQTSNPWSMPPNEAVKALTLAFKESEQRVQELTNKIHEMHSSNSWKVTLPLRTISSKLRLIKQLVSRLPQTFSK